MNSATDLRNKVISHLPAFVLALFVIQPLMDVLSFWMGKYEMSNTLTLLLRMGVLGLTVLAGFWLSNRKWVYWTAAGIVGAVALGHVFTCVEFGYRSPFTDLANYVRVVQMPLTALCLITFLRRNEKCYDAMKWGLLYCLLIMLAVEVLAIVTGTEPHTYMDGKGYMGWFSNTNSQSSNLVVLSPIAVALLYRRYGFKSWKFWTVFLASMTAMFFMGPRLCFLGIVATGVGLGVCMVIIRPALWKRALVFALVALIFVSFVSVSPMVLHQSIYESVQADRQSSINDQLEEFDLPPLNEEGISQEERERRKALWLEALTPIYSLYAPDFVEMFGPERTIEMYNYTKTVTDITALRPKKLQFARLLMDDSPFSARLFGVELARFTVNGNIYDVENDLYGIYFLYGYAGLAAMVAFLGYFLGLILRALLKDWKTYFTFDAASWGIALVMCMLHVVFTAGVLRRPNASIYLSAILAAVYYLVKIKRYPAPELSLEKES